MKLAVVLFLTLLLTACTRPVGPTAEEPAGSRNPSPSATSLPTSSANASFTPATSPTFALASTAPIEAASRLLALDGARVRLVVERAKGSGPPEVLIAAEGAVDPAVDRGAMTYDYSRMFAIPGAPTGSPDPLSVVELRWDATDLFLRFPLEEDSSGWTRKPRKEAEISGGLIGRLPREIHGLVSVVAGAAPASVERLPDGEVEGADAARFLVRVPLEDAVAQGVPGDTPHVDAIRNAYGIDAIPVEVWLVGGELRRIGYVFEREKAPYGGPDRTSVTYDWSSLGTPAEIEIPPPGPIEDR